MILLLASISLYVLLIAVILPCCFGNIANNAQYVDDSLMWMMMTGATLVEVCRDMTNTCTNDRCFDPQKRRCISDIFSELGPYWIRRSL